MLNFKILKGKKGKILAAIMNTIIPRRGAYGPGAADYDLLPKVEAYIRSFNPMVRFGFPFLLWYIEYGSLFKTGKLFTRLLDEDAVGYLESFEDSRLYYMRSIMLLFKMITMLAFYDIDENASLIGYTHLSHIEPKRIKKVTSS